jgi:hypothetical protein
LKIQNLYDEVLKYKVWWAKKPNFTLDWLPKLFWKKIELWQLFTGYQHFFIGKLTAYSFIRNVKIHFLWKCYTNRWWRSKFTHFLRFLHLPIVHFGWIHFMTTTVLPVSKLHPKNKLFRNSSAADDIHLEQTIYHLCRPIIIPSGWLSSPVVDYDPQWLIMIPSGWISSPVVDCNFKNQPSLMIFVSLEWISFSSDEYRLL